MEYLSEDRLKLLLNKEWLVKTDNDNSIPYLLKFYASTVDLCCFIIVTDTKNVWGEVLPSKAFARRWRDCNPSHSPSVANESQEDEWRTNILELLTNAHSLGGIEELTFEIVPSNNADLAFELGSEGFKWRWETYHQGPKVSAEIISRQLIMPLISVTHLAFSSADPVSELSEANLEKAVDKLGRTGRRTVDTHVKHAISRPRLTTTLNRMTSMFNFLPDLPPILSKVDPPTLRVPTPPPQLPELTRTRNPNASSQVASPGPSRTLSKQTTPEPKVLSFLMPNQPLDQDDSATEPEDDEDEAAIPPIKREGKEPSRGARRSSSPNINTTDSAIPPKRAGVARSRQSTPISDAIQSQSSKAPSGSKGPDLPSDPMSSSPLRPAKKKRVVESSSSDEDSEAERKRRVTKLKGGATRGAKQPLRRGGKRF